MNGQTSGKAFEVLAGWIGTALIGALVGLVVSLAAAWRLMLLVVAVALGGCAALPPPVDRLPSHARTDVADSALARLAARSLDVASGADGDADAAMPSAFHLLPEGGDALAARLALVRRAEKSLDVQSYLIADDASGRQLLDALRDAARRGVRVRLLVDDLYAGGRDAEFAALAAERNVEVRLFNPLPVRSGGLVRRIVGSLHELPRINRRMHNKLFVADGSFAIAGGRNVADAYFDRAGEASFIDMDVLAAGPVVTTLSAVFDRYWNAESSHPAGRFARPAPRHRDPPSTAPSPHADEADAFDARLADGRLAFDRAVADVLADAPEKALGDDRETTVADAHLALLRSAESSILVASPYVIPCRETVAAFAGLRARDGSVVLLTNSLATTDEPLVHLGYARHRPALLQAGVDLHELSAPARADGAPPSAFDVSAGRSSLGRLHGKLAVVDGRTAFIGSMNLDPRSARLNTELALVVHSPRLAARIAAFVDRHRQQASDRVVRHDAGVRWQTDDGGVERLRTSEPAPKSMPRLPMRVLARLLGDDYL